MANSDSREAIRIKSFIQKEICSNVLGLKETSYAKFIMGRQQFRNLNNFLMEHSFLLSDNQIQPDFFWHSPDENMAQKQ